MCWEDGSFARWETTWDTAATDTTPLLYSPNATDTEQTFTLPEWTEKETKPKRKSKWMEKKLKRYDR